MKKINKLLIAFLLVFFAFSCSPQKRLNRLHKKHPYLFNTEKITVRDTIKIPEHKTDTFFSANFDTVRILDQKHEIILIKNDSLIYVYSHIFADTVFIEKIIEVDKAQIIKKHNYDSLFKYIVLFMCLLLLFIIISAVRK
jgi:hypothetical protein